MPPAASIHLRFMFRVAQTSKITYSRTTGLFPDEPCLIASKPKCTAGRQATMDIKGSPALYITSNHIHSLSLFSPPPT